MREFYIIILLTVSIQITAFAQSCLPNGWQFNEQVDIDDFAINYPGCSKIGGTIHIIGDDITNLDGLYPVTEIQGDLLISFGSSPLTNLVDFSGLDNLVHIDGDFIIGVYYSSHTPSLKNFTGLGSLKSIGGNMEIGGCESLDSFTGLDNLDSIGGQLFVKNNDALKYLFGTNSLSYIGGDLIIVANDSLLNPSGLENINSINNNVVIGRKNGQSINETNLSLIDLEGLNNLNFVSGDFTIENNPSLKSLSGLNNLVSVGNDFFIEYCDSLLSLNGLAQLNSVGHRFEIQFNNSLFDISSLQGFQGEGENCWLSISWNDCLKNLVGLEGIDSIFAIYVHNNDSLYSLEGLNNLQHVTHLYVSGPLLNSIEALSNLQIVEENLTIKECQNLPSLNGLQNVTSIGGDFIIRECRITDAIALNKLEDIGGTFELYMCGNDIMNNLTNLNSIHESLIISNTGFSDLSGLENLTYVGEDIEILWNYSLTSIDGIRNIDASFLDKIIIERNRDLSICNIQSVCDFLQIHQSDAFFSLNDSGCNGRNEVEEACIMMNNSCLPEGIIFNSQADIESFQNLYSDCNIIEGPVTIDGNEIIDLSSLGNISTIGNDLTIINNDNLSALNGFENLISIDGNLIIKNNTQLININAITNILHSSIDSLIVENNPKLSTCDIQCFCDYLFSPLESYIINNNYIGCNSKLEIITECSSGIIDSSIKPLIVIFPNPARSTISIVNHSLTDIKNIEIYNQFGQVLLKFKGDGNDLNIESLENGFYIVEVTLTKSKFRSKLLIN